MSAWVVRPPMSPESVAPFANLPAGQTPQADLESAIALLNAQDLTLSAAQAAFAKINRQTMFDLLN